MKIKIVTTITTLLDTNTLARDHSVMIESDDAIPEDLAKAVVIGACKSTLKQLEPEGGE